MKVRAKEPCFVDRLFREAGEAFDWRNAKDEPLPACLESLEPVPDPEPGAEAEAEAGSVPDPESAPGRRGRQRKQG